MTIYTIENGSPVGKAFKVLGGRTIIAPGEKGEVDTLYPLTEAQIEALAQDKVKVTAAKAKADAPPTGPTAVHRGGGSYSVMDGDKEAVEKLTKEEAEAFNKLDADAKAKFITERTKA